MIESCSLNIVASGWVACLSPRYVCIVPLDVRTVERRMCYGYGPQGEWAIDLY